MISDKANLGEYDNGPSGPEGFISDRNWVRCTIFGLFGVNLDKSVLSIVYLRWRSSNLIPYTD